jgi:hypothetical protein
MISYTMETVSISSIGTALTEGFGSLKIPRGGRLMAIGKGYSEHWLIPILLETYFDAVFPFL